MNEQEFDKIKKQYNKPNAKHMLEIAKKYMNFSKWKDEFEVIVEVDNEEDEEEEDV